MRDIAFYQEHLDRVSRSFAFCIQKLEPPLRHWVSLSYLLCRVLDTVEDSPWPPDVAGAALRDEQFLAFDSFMRTEPTAEAVRRWSARFPALIPPGEKTLLEDAPSLFADLHSLPRSAREVIQKAVRQMSQGMKTYSERAVVEKGGVLRLRDLTDVNRYCYFVAGVVGELLSRLVIEQNPGFQPPRDFFRNAFHFGLFLQKVNLLKDQPTDEAEGRFLVPDRQQLLASLSENAEGSLAYLVSLPIEEKGYRTFCAWSLFLGAASLSWIERRTKIPRAITQELLGAIESIVQDNEALLAGFDEYFPKLPALSADREGAHAALSAVDADWFARLSSDSLGPADRAELRMM